jgi:adenylate kinase family enzyme
MRRISVIGSSGAGKTTLSRVLAKAIGGTHIELDALYHGPNWTPTADNEFRRRVGALVENECWVIDGNYSTVRDLVWSAADTVVWIDLPRRTILPSLLRRTLTRMWRGTALWNGNRERFRQLLDPRAEENVLLWMWTTHRAARQMYSAALADPRWSHLEHHRLDSRARLAEFRRRSFDGPG